MRSKFWSAFALLLIPFSTMAQSPPPIGVYDGFWIGTWECSENLLPNPRLPKGFSAKVTFRVAAGTGEAANEYGNDVNKFTLGIRPDGTVAVENLGHDKTNTTRAWTIKAQGVMHRGHLKATGRMTTADGATTIRALCQFDLSNRETEARLDEHARREKLAVEEAAREEARRAEAAAQAAKPVSPARKEKVAAADATAKTPAPAKAAPAKPAAPLATPAPAPAAPRDENPARVAAIANVPAASATPATTAAPATKGYTKVTANPVDQVNRKSANDVWINFNPAISVQERQFCRIVENYRAEYNAAATTRNQIKINETQRNFAQALVALLPDGKFQGWVMRSISVSQAGDGSADILFELPCNVYVGSNACDANPKNFTGTISEGSRVYSELAKMTVNDFSLAGGQFVHTDDKAFDKNRTVASFTHMKTEAHCKAKSMALNGDFFAIRLQNLSMIK